MNAAVQLPRLLVIDDLFGRSLSGERNRERANLCGQFLIEDVTGDEDGKQAQSRIKTPIAQAVFTRGQTPQCAAPGDIVRNDLDGTLKLIADGWTELLPDRPRWALVLLDLCFYTGSVTDESHRRVPGMAQGLPGDDDPESYFGLQILEAIHERFPDLPVVILSSKPRDQVSLTFTRHGALAFLPRADERSPQMLREYISRHGLIPDDTSEIVGRSLPLLLALRSARQMALEQRNVLILGERGSGKELLARYLHRHSPKASTRPLVVVDSGALSPNLFASELFGHRRGAFTGADRDRTGRILQANGGDLFLDEIGNMPPDVQIGLLRVLEQRIVTPLGATEGQSVDVRFLSATNEDLQGRALTGNFREDLLDRLRSGGTVILPPLRDRLEDLEMLVERLVREAEQGRPGAMRRQVEPEVLEKLRTHSWPGNIRELRSCIHQAVSSHPDVEHLVPVHVRLEKGIVSAQQDERVETPSVPAHTTQASDPLSALIAAMDRLELKDVRSSELVGKLPLLQTAYERLVAQLLRAALQVTRKPTPEHPSGEILIHPAVKLLVGDKSLTASKAADIIKRLLGKDPTTNAELLADPLLAEAFQTAVRLRPRQPRRKTDASPD